jgi:hypothetical protein
MWPLYPVPRPEALKADRWCGLDGYLRELGRAPRYRLDTAAVRAWRRALGRSVAIGGLRPAPTERALRETAGAYVMFALWAAMRHKAAEIQRQESPEARFALRAELAKFIAWHVRELLSGGKTLEGRSAGRELANLLYLTLTDPESLHGAEYTWTPREYCAAMNSLLGVEHPFDDGTAIARHGARLEGFL